MEINSNDYQNDWANNIKSVPIHIDNASSGAKGYYCLGCGKEMQAVKYKNPKHQSYFRHHASNIDKEKTECVVASKIYRERLAEQILHRLKELKVPTLLKYPPKGQEGNPMFLEEARIVKAKKVMSQLSFYENKDGEIKWGKNPKIEERYLLIRPDITFFDEKDEPVLFIEFVITHKINDEKRVKLSRIGIDTVQIIIPKLPENEIEKSLKSVRKIKWVYNGIEASTPYISTSKGDTERVFPIDEEQRELFEESYACTAAKVNNLIRAIKSNLGSQSYKRAELLFEQEISRIEKATKRTEKELGEMEKKFEEEIFSGFAGEFENFEEKRRDFKNREEKFRQNFIDLERRYFRKKRELEEETREFDEKERGIGQAIEQCLEAGTTEREIRERFRKRAEIFENQISREEEAISENFKIEEGRIAENIKSEQRLLEEHKQTEKQLPVKFGQLEAREQQNHTANKNQLERETEIFEQQIEHFGDFSKQKEGELTAEFEKFREQSAKRIKQRDCRGGDELSERIKTVLEAGRLSSGYNEALSTYERHKKHLEIARRNK